MEIKSLIDVKNSPLYDSVVATYPIELVESDNGQWGSNLKNGIAVISYAPTAHPQASFTHELLHVDTQMKGYVRIRAGASLDLSIHSSLSRICTAVDNEFQHHKMYGHFIKLGYAPNEFYHDGDSLTEKYLEDVLLEPGQPLLSLAIDYLTAIAPGGSMTDATRERLRHSLHSYGESVFAVALKNVDAIIAEWTKSESFNAEPFIQKFLETIGCQRTWISYDEKGAHFPSNGFFVRETFTGQELMKAFGHG